MIYQVDVGITAREVKHSPEQLWVVTAGAAIVENRLNVSREADAAPIVVRFLVVRFILAIAKVGLYASLIGWSLPKH